MVRHHRKGSCCGSTTGRTATAAGKATATANLSSVERTSKKEYGEYNQRTKSFLLLPFFLILDDGGGRGSAVECSVIHHDSCGCGRSFFRSFRISRKEILCDDRVGEQQQTKQQTTKIGIITILVL
jgi:hypothetical protein